MTALSATLAAGNRRPVIARSLWVVVAGSTVALAAAGLAGQYDALSDISSEYRRSLTDLGVSDSTYAGYVTGLGIIAVLVHVLIAAVIAWRRPDDWMALFVSLTLVANGAVNPFAPLHTLVEAHADLDLPVNFLAYFAVLSSISLLYVFPTGRFAPAWTLPLALVWAVVAGPAVFAPDSAISIGSWPAALQVLVLLALASTGPVRSGV